jgi:predicted glycosyltransferase
MTGTQILEEYEQRGWNDNTKLNMLLALLDRHPELNDEWRKDLDEAEAVEEYYDKEPEVDVYNDDDFDEDEEEDD